MRKSISFGGFRFNLSNSGVGASVGITGLHFGKNTKGNYVHLGQNGMFYRSALHQKRIPLNIIDNQQALSHLNPNIQEQQLLFHEIKSKRTALLTDSSSKELIDEINSKRKKLSFWPFAIPLVFIPKLGVFISVALILFLYFLVDKPRKTTFLVYDIDKQVEKEIRHFYHSFKELMDCSMKWHIAATAKVGNRKYFAGAKHLQERFPISIDYKQPSILKTNVRVPCIPVGKQRLYFLPDRVLIVERNAVAAINYANISAVQSNSRLIESEAIPFDSHQVGQTWSYVNKDGGPDRRFRYNRILPILLYSKIHFTSPSGLNEIIQLSKPKVGCTLDASLKLYSSKGFLAERSEATLPSSTLLSLPNLDVSC